LKAGARNTLDTEYCRFDNCGYEIDEEMPQNPCNNSLLSSRIPCRRTKKFPASFFINLIFSAAYATLTNNVPARREIGFACGRVGAGCNAVTAGRPAE
jgi:hypothetical protein